MTGSLLKLETTVLIAREETDESVSLKPINPSHAPVELEQQNELLSRIGHFAPTLRCGCVATAPAVGELWCGDMRAAACGRGRRHGLA